MANSIISEHEIYLNGVRFPIDGFVRESLISRFPAKQTVGDFEYSNEQILSNFIINDQRGGLLVEEMDESIHQDRYWWSTCDTRFRSNILLPPLATALTIPSDVTAPTIVNADCEGTDGWTGGNAQQAGPHTGTYSWGVAAGGTTYQDLTWANGDRGHYYTFTCWVRTAVATNARISINDNANTTYSSYHSGGGTYEQLTVSAHIAATGTRLRIQVHDAGAGTDVYFDDAAITVRTGLDAYPSQFADFNSKNYAACGNGVIKLNAGGTGYDFLYDFAVDVTDLVVSSDGYLLIFLGDSTNYYYMSTSDVFAQTDVALANKGLRWDGKTWKMAVNGRWWYIVAPSVASPVWTAADASGGLDDYALTPKSLDVYFDANGNQIPYCATTKGLWAYDADNAMWTETSIILPEHSQTGLGLVIWGDALYVSGGLSVRKYIVAATATDTQVGLTQDDSLPQLRSGEIVKFIKGYDEFFALIDSTYEGVTSRSQVVSYDGTGWRTWWETPLITDVNKNMYSGIVTSVVKHQLIFSTTDGAYSIPLYRTSPNPKKVSGYTYATSGVHITPRFDAGTKAFPKLATKLTLFLDDMSSTETVAVSYQIDQAQGALTSAWTSLISAQTADGVVEQTFGTDGVGIEFYDIQFRAALAQAGASTTSPIIKGMVLSYLKLLGRKKAWSFTINTSEAAQVSSDPKTLMDAINTILGTNTLMPFIYRDGSRATDTHYCFLQPYSSFTPTGNNYQGLANITLIEI